MPMYDVECPAGHQGELLAAVGDQYVPCRVCGAPTTRIWRGRAGGVVGDALDYVDEHLGPEPIHITSRSQRARIMSQRGLVEKIRHVDGDKHTSRWI